MARRGLLFTADVLEELELDQGDFDDDELMMPGSDDEFEDVYLEDLEDDEDDDDFYSPPPSDIPGTSQGFVQDFSSEGGNHSVWQYTQTRGSGGMLPQENFEIYDL